MGDVSLLNPQIALVNEYLAARSKPGQHEDYSGRAAKAVCAIGRAYVIDGTPNSALYSFLQALVVALGMLTLTRLLNTWNTSEF